MGTDIHMRAEYKNSKGKWTAIGDIFKDTNYEYAKKMSSSRGITIEEYTKENPWVKEYTDEPYGDRNYVLFTILANVRNRNGKTEPICEPRGLPGDMSEELENYFEADYYHDHSYITLAELMEYDWKKENIEIGYIDEAQYIDLKFNNVTPKMWSNMIGGKDIVAVTDSEMQDILQGRVKRDKGVEYHIRTSFSTGTIADNCDFFCSDTIPTLCKVLVSENIDDPDDIRIVFGFDS